MVQPIRKEDGSLVVEDILHEMKKRYGKESTMILSGTGRWRRR